MKVWTEKYRPATLEEVKGQEEVVSRLKSLIKSESMPHLLFSGPAGVGKTTCALAISRGLYGEKWRENVLELNASVTGDTPLLIRKGKNVQRTTFGELAENYFKDSNSEYSDAKDIEVLSLDKDDYKIKFMRVKSFIRHKVDSILKFNYEGGLVKTSKAHSVIVLDKFGELKTKKSEELKVGDSLITFCEDIESSDTILDLESFSPKEYNLLRSGLQKNPKINTILKNQSLTEDISWLFGLYLAEGCTSLQNNTKGQVVLTVSNTEQDLVDRSCDILQNSFGLTTTSALASSGFNRENLTSIQVRTNNTQLVKFLRNNFYSGNAKKAPNKRIPNFIFSSSNPLKVAFLKGYADGDGSGKWDELIRYSSVSQENLVDTSWLARISGLNSSCFDGEARIVWKLPSYSYIKSEFIPAEIAINVAGDSNKYALRHQLYGKNSKRLSKDAFNKIIQDLQEKGVAIPTSVRKLVNSSLSVVAIKSVEEISHNDYVYDISVPGAEMFWGGTTPILLHNSDERGIDVIRDKVKEFARMKGFEVPFKIIYLDEADHLTKEAQAALRRTMEDYAIGTRFILSCNYVSKIIPPIQSRCAMFRFKPVEQRAFYEVLKNIAKKEDYFDITSGRVEDEHNGVKDDALGLIYEASEGDLRKAENILQSCAAMLERTFAPGEKELLGTKDYGGGLKGFTQVVIDTNLVRKVVAFAEPAEVQKMINCSLRGDFISARSVLHELMFKGGLSGQDVVKSVMSEVVKMDIPDAVKVKLVSRIGEYEFRMVEGANEVIQLTSMLAEFAALK